MAKHRHRLIYLATLAVCLTFMSSYVRAHDDLHEQIVLVTAKIKRDPKNASLYLQRGELHRLRRDWRRAAADYDRAERLQPSLTTVDLARGKMFFESRRPLEARRMLDRFLSRQPDDVDGLVTRARVLAAIGARVEAVRDFTGALTLDKNPDPALYLERAQVLAVDEQHEEMLRGLDEGIKRLGPVVTLELAAIDLEIRRKNFDAALTRLDLIAAQSERKEIWLVRRGEILRSAGRIDEARESFKAALLAIEALSPDRRQSRAITELELRARSGLKAL